MRGNTFVIGVDVGTTSTRAIIFDGEGSPVAEGRASYPLLRPQPGWVEQRAEWWWQAFQNATKEALNRANIDGKRIAAVGVTHQRITTVPVDENIEPVRNAILWNDIRCSKQNEWAREKIGAERIYSRTGNFPSIWTVYKAMWLKENEPEIYRKTHKFLLVQDYVIYKLTGRLATTSSSAIQTGCLDVASPRRWAEDVLDLLGIPVELWVDEILPGGEVVGEVTREASDSTGLPLGLPVVTTAGDQPCGALGAGVDRPGILAINGGTSCSLEACVRELKLDPNLNYFIEISPTGDYLLEDSIWSGGSALMNWYKDNFAGEDVWDSIYDLATQVPPGNKGLMLIPYYSGAASPYWDLRARGVIFGFLLDHGRPHLVRAILEGVAFESRRKKEFMERGSSVPIAEVRMYGGSARSSVWNQIFADVLGVDLSTLKTPETTSLGAAICAAKGVGVYPSFREAVGAMVHIDERFSPDPERKGLYDRLYSEVYSKFYDRVHDLIHTASRIVEGSP
ncbi:MAG: xylulokinase [bacterium]